MDRFIGPDWSATALGGGGGGRRGAETRWKEDTSDKLRVRLTYLRVKGIIERDKVLMLSDPDRSDAPAAADAVRVTLYGGLSYAAPSQL